MQIAPRTASEIRAELEPLGAELLSLLNALDRAESYAPEDRDLVALGMEARLQEITEAMARLKAEHVESIVIKTEIPDDISSLVAGE